METTHRPGRDSPLGGSAEDFLRAVYILRQDSQAVATSALADYLGLSDAAVTKMARRLDGLGLVAHTRYRGVALSPAGERVALEVVRHHRLIESFLAEFLAYDLASVHAEADRLEHVVSPSFIERLDRALGHPRRDPHGDPIPTPAGDVPEVELARLSTLEAGQRATVGRILAQRGDVLSYLADLGLVPGSAVEVVEVAPFGGPVSVRVGDVTRALDRDLAADILVDELEAADGIAR